MLQQVNALARHRTGPVGVVMVFPGFGRVGRMFRTATQAPVPRPPAPATGAVMAARAQALVRGGGGVLAEARLVLDLTIRQRAQGLVKRLGAA